MYDFPHTKVNCTHKSFYGNNVVYGALYVLTDEFFHLRTLDAYHLCSLSSIGRNHDLDLTHRTKGPCTPIYFKSLDELDRLLYEEGQPIEAMYYVANPSHPTTQYRVRRITYANYRILNGIDVTNFKEQWRNVFNGRKQFRNERRYVKKSE